VENGKRKR